MFCRARRLLTCSVTLTGTRNACLFAGLPRPSSAGGKVFHGGSAWPWVRACVSRWRSRERTRPEKAAVGRVVAAIAPPATCPLLNDLSTLFPRRRTTARLGRRSLTCFRHARFLG